MHIESFNSRVFEKYSKVSFDSITPILEKVFEQDISVNIVFVNRRKIRELNREYRGKEYVTDVLSFNLDNIGEVYICPKYVKRNFKGSEFVEEIVRLSIHGILHLLGYEHKGKFTDVSEEEIFKIQEHKVKRVLNYLKGKMYLLVGLGNPGKEYEDNRHNAGFMMIDRLYDLLEDDRVDAKKWGKDKIVESEVVVSKKGDIDIALIKPTTFMNNSGIAVKKAIKRFNIEDISEQVILIHDDLDIELGKYKIQREKSPRGHNGVKNVEDQLGTTDFLRIRLGVENREGKDIAGEKYVLMDLTEDEKVSLNEAIDLAIKELFLYLK